MPDTTASGKVHIADLVTCPKCGQSNAIGERYCTSCGTHLIGDAPIHMARSEPSKKQGILGRLFARK